jgi:hypothetical protein
LPGSFEAVHKRHGDIHDHDIRLQRLGQLDSLTAIAGFANNFKIWLFFQNPAEPFSQYVVVVSQ